MLSTRTARTLLAAVGIAAATALASDASAQNTFTYQGVLEESGSPVTGTKNLSFRLFDAPVGGTLIGGTTLNFGVDVEDGVFTAQLDFGPLNTADLADAWLEITVDGTTLTRQRLTATPFALNTRGIAVLPNGDTGIGTDSPASKLHVSDGVSGVAVNFNDDLIIDGGSGDASIHLMSRDNQESAVFFGNPGNGARTGAIIYNAFNGSNDNGLNFRVDDGSELTAMSITQNGNVGIGTTNPARLLHVREAATGASPNPNARLVVEGTSGTGSWIHMLSEVNDEVGILLGNPSTNVAGALIWNDVSDHLQLRAGGNTTRMVVEGNGNVGIGTASPSFRLEVNGSAGKPGGGSWSNSSDRRLKKNIESIDNALETVLALQGVTYEYKDAEAINELPGERIGFIAQDVEAVIPDWISEHEDGYKRMTIRGFEALAVEAFREQQDQIAAMQAEIESLKQACTGFTSSLTWPMVALLGVGGIAVARRRVAKTPAE